MQGAALVPLAVAERATALAARLVDLAAQSPAKVASDVETARALAAAACAGAQANVRINLDSITDEAFRKEVESRLAGMSRA
jgi:formiminotetrahydrofolate cyclodeaminase